MYSRHEFRRSEITLQNPTDRRRGFQPVSTPKQIRIIGVPLDLGQSRRGVDMGPSAVRVAGLEARLEAIGHMVEDGGNVRGRHPGTEERRRSRTPSI